MTRSRRGAQFDNNPIKYSPALDPVNTIILARSRVVNTIILARSRVVNTIILARSRVVNTIILARSRVGLYLIGSQLSIPCNTEHNTSTKTAQMG